MARKTNYKFEKLERERRKAEKKAAKAEAKRAASRGAEETSENTGREPPPGSRDDRA